MPESKQRLKHHQHQHSHQQPPNTPHRPPTKAATVMAIFTVVLGAGIAFFAVGASYIWMPVGGIIGGVIGYLIGNSMDKAAARK